VVSSFCAAAIRGQELEVYGDGRQTRSFAYVDDTVEALVRMMEQEEQIGPVNIGNPDEVTILELASLAIELAGSSSKLKILPARPDDPVRRKPDISLARKLLTWEPRVPLNSGIRKTIDYMRTELGMIAT
jgi:UDP-glucuronate decarboxylase